MIKPKYNIGDVVFVGEWKAYEHWDKCPDCGGGKTLKVTLFDGTEYIINCETCGGRFDNPCGVVKTVRYKASVIELVIQGMELGCFERNKGLWEYHLGLEGASCRIVPDYEIFLDEQAAMNFALAKGRQMAIDEDARKDKPNHAWAWHVTYHRREIKEATRRLEYSQRKLGIAREKAKEQKAKGAPYDQ